MDTTVQYDQTTKAPTLLLNARIRTSSKQVGSYNCKGTHGEHGHFLHQRSVCVTNRETDQGVSIPQLVHTKHKNSMLQLINI